MIVKVAENVNKLKMEYILFQYILKYWEYSIEFHCQWEITKLYQIIGSAQVISVRPYRKCVAPSLTTLAVKCKIYSLRKCIFNATNLWEIKKGVFTPNNYNFLYIHGKWWRAWRFVAMKKHLRIEYFAVFL